MGDTRSSSDAPALPRPSTVQLRARRSPKLIAGGVLAVVLGAIGFGYVYQASLHEHAVVAIAQPVWRGTIITDEHLRVVTVPAKFAIEATPDEDHESLIGQTALTDLPVGSFPLKSHVGKDPLPDGDALVGLRLIHGQLPVSPMPAGAIVDLVPIGDAPSTPALEDAVAAKPVPASDTTRATVAVEPVMLDDGLTFVLDVRVPKEQAGAIARAAARGELAIVTVSEG